MSDPDPVNQEPVFKDCKTGLVLFGALQIGLGSLCALMIPLMLLGMMAAKAMPNNAAPPMDTRMMIPALLGYLLYTRKFYPKA